MPPDDRDHRKQHPVPEHVRAQTPAHGTEVFDEETPVHGDPVTQINKRAGQAASNARGAFAAIREVRSELKVQMDRDELAHNRLFESIDRTNDKLDTTNQIVGELREAVGEISGQMSVIVKGYEAEQQARVDGEVIRIKSVTEVNTHAKKAEIDDEKDQKSYRRKKVMWALGVVASLGTGFATLITLLAGRC